MARGPKGGGRTEEEMEREGEGRGSDRSDPSRIESSMGNSQAAVAGVARRICTRNGTIRLNRGIVQVASGAGEYAARSKGYSHTMPSLSASRMYQYAGCERGTGAMPCRRASLQVIMPLRLSS